MHLPARVLHVSKRRPAQPLPRLLHGNSLPTLPRPTHPHDSPYKPNYLLCHHPPQRCHSPLPRLHRRRNNILLRHQSHPRRSCQNHLHHRRRLRTHGRYRFLRLHRPNRFLSQETANVEFAVTVEFDAHFEYDVVVCGADCGSGAGS